MSSLKTKLEDLKVRNVELEQANRKLHAQRADALDRVIEAEKRVQVFSDACEDARYKLAVSEGRASGLLEALKALTSNE